jgi:hypothetical protein
MARLLQIGYKGLDAGAADKGNKTRFADVFPLLMYAMKINTPLRAGGGTQPAVYPSGKIAR